MFLSDLLNILQHFAACSTLASPIDPRNSRPQTNAPSRGTFAHKETEVWSVGPRNIQKAMKMGGFSLSLPGIYWWNQPITLQKSSWRAAKLLIGLAFSQSKPQSPLITGCFLGCFLEWFSVFWSVESTSATLSAELLYVIHWDQGDLQSWHTFLSLVFVWCLWLSHCPIAPWLKWMSWWTYNTSPPG